MSNLFWNTTLCAVNTLCTESWPLIPLRSSWIIIPRPSISEGTISLFVTVIAMLIVALFFRIHNYLWCPSYDAKSREEEGEWLMIANGISNACVGWALLLGGVGIVRRRIRVWSFILAIGFPLASWALISTISGLTQLSIHSVVALQQKMQKMTIQACNLTSLITLFDGTDFSQPKLLDRTSVLPVGSSEEVGAALISGLSQNFTSFLFTHEGMLCSGQYFQNSYFTTQCLVGRAVCNSTRLTVNPTTGIVSSSSTPMSAPVPYIGDRLNVSQLRIISTSNNSITHPTNPSRQGAALSSLTIQYGYTSNSAIPYANIETWKPNQTIYTKTSNTAVSPLIRVYSTSGIPTDHWGGTCYQSIHRCNLTITNGRTTSLTDCQEQAFNCWERRNPTTPTPPSLPIPRICQDKIGIGEIWRGDSVVSSTILNIMRNTKSTDFTFLIESAISRLSLAWIASALPLDLSSNLRFIVYQNLEIADRTPVDAVAIDLVLLCTLLVASVVVLILYVGVCVVSLLGSWDEGYEARKARWDALEKLAGTYCTKGEMTPRLSVKSEESPMSLRKAYRNKGIKVNTGVKVVEASVETPTSATSEMGTPVVGVHRSGSRSRLVKAVSVRRSATLEKEEVMVSKGKEEVAGKGDGEIKRPLWEVLFTREGWERVMEMLGERPRHKAPRKVYTVCTMSNALKKAA